MGFARRPSDRHGLAVGLEGTAEVVAFSTINSHDLLISYLLQHLQAGLTSCGTSGGSAAYRYHGKGPGMGSIGNGRSSASF